ncbi:MAG: diphthine synthase [Candidatus Bilamarchaeaceae archaeon]
MLYLIGLGVSFDITLSGIEAAKASAEIYYDDYTNLIDKAEIAKLEGAVAAGTGSGAGAVKKFIPLAREKLESEFLPRLAKERDIALLVSGDPLSATTHVTLMLDCRKLGVECKVIHNSSIFSVAPGAAGLQHYRFGKTATIVFPRPNYKPSYPVKVLRQNLDNDMHTLLLLDIDRELGAMPAETGLALLQEFADEAGVPLPKLAVLSRLGHADQKVSYGNAADLLKSQGKLGKPPFSIIVPGKLHPVEQEFLDKL